jgi:iron-sulfur cluster assembly protein
MITLTERAANEIRRVMTEQKFPEATFVRVGVAGGGCSGFQYSFGFDDQVDPAKDHVSDQHGIKVAVQKNHDLHLDGTVIDFYEDLQRRGFKFDNPNVSRSCGCGSSFSV